MVESIDFIDKGNNIIVVVCNDGKVSMDRRVYEQKLGTLLGCSSSKEIFEIAQSSTSYLEEHYKTKEIVKPVRW